MFKFVSHDAKAAAVARERRNELSTSRLRLSNKRYCRKLEELYKTDLTQAEIVDILTQEFDGYQFTLPQLKKDLKRLGLTRYRPRRHSKSSIPSPEARRSHDSRDDDRLDFEQHGMHRNMFIKIAASANTPCGIFKDPASEAPPFDPPSSPTPAGNVQHNSSPRDYNYIDIPLPYNSGSFRPVDFNGHQTTYASDTQGIYQTHDISLDFAGEEGMPVEESLPSYFDTEMEVTGDFEEYKSPDHDGGMPPDFEYLDPTVNWWDPSRETWDEPATRDN